MPATYTGTPVDQERKNAGIGGKPPVDRRPTGGGGDGDWDNRPPGRRGPHDRLTRFRMIVLFGLIGDMMFFVAIASTFFARQGSGHLDAHNNYTLDWRPIALPPILWLNTALLLLSSVTMEVARQHIFRETDVMEEWLGLGKPAVRRARPWLIATLILGVLFLAGQWAAWNQLWALGSYSSDNPASYFFYLITGSHAAHLILGVFAVGLALGLVEYLQRVEYRQIAVDITAWYWHAMGACWLFLMGLLIWGQ